MIRAQTTVDLKISYLPWQPDVFFGSDRFKYVIVPKGRRVGATQGAMHAIVEWAMDGISPILWVDTINGNIDRYFERYLLPVLKRLPDSQWKWNANKKLLHLMDSIVDFRSADAPESIEGFGYKKIILNEAGIILKDDYLYNNTILPMMLDYPDSQLFAIGVPKGIHKKDGNEHVFYTLAQRALNGRSGYRYRHLTSYDNPLLTQSDIDELMAEMATEQQRLQEIFGQFVDNAGDNPFAAQYDPKIHESESAILVPRKQLFISIDFNLNPFGVAAAHIWRDNSGMHFHTVAEKEIPRGSIPGMIEYLKTNFAPYLPNCYITGDFGGTRGDLSQSDQASYFEQIRRGLGLSRSQIVVPPNPTHETSRSDCNYILHRSANPDTPPINCIDVQVHPKNAKGVSRDLQNVQCDAFGQIIKRDRKDTNQRADLLDCWRYLVNTFLKKWIIGDMKQRAGRRKS